MSVYVAMGRLAQMLEPRIGWDTVAAAMDGITELPTKREMEEAVAWLARDNGLVDTINSQPDDAIVRELAA